MEVNVIADKIKYFRKKLNLSQEELGQKLFVSKQTISLWEKGQTVPTVDNLIRLKEIFGVSVDDFFISEIEENIASDAKEEYSFSHYTDAELLELKKHRTSPFVISIVVFSIASLILILLCLDESLNSFGTGIAIGLLAFVLTFTIGLFQNRSGVKKDIKTLKSHRYKILVYDDCFFFEIEENNKISGSGTVKFTEISSIEDIGKTLIVAFGNGYILMRKEYLKSDSVFYSLAKEIVEKKKLKPPVKKWKAISIILLIVSLFSCFIADFFYLLCFDFSLKHIWFFYLFLIIPLASLCFAFVLRKKGYKYKKNVIVSIIMLMIFIAAGQMYDNHNDEYIKDDYLYDFAETILLSTELPEYSVIAYMDWEENIEIVRNKEYVYCTTDLFFNQEDVVEFEKDIKTDSRWITKIPEDMKCYMTSIVSADAYDYMFIYNSTNDEFNKRFEAAEDEEYHDFICGCYNSKTNQMKLVEYSLFVG